MMIAAPQSEARSFVKTDVELQIVGPLEACPLAESLGKSGLWQARSIAVLVPCPRAGFTSAASRLCREKSPVQSHVCFAARAATLQLQLTNHSFGLSTFARRHVDGTCESNRIVGMFPPCEWEYWAAKSA